MADVFLVVVVSLAAIVRTLAWDRIVPARRAGAGWAVNLTVLVYVIGPIALVTLTVRAIV